MMQKEAERICLLSWPEFTFYWDQITKCLEETDFDQYYNRDWLLRSVEEGSVKVWALTDGLIRMVAFSRLYDCKRGKVLQIFWGMGQDLDRFLDMANEVMDKVAVVLEASYIEIVGRRGWIRKMRKFGFETESYIISRPVGRRRNH